MWSRRAGWRRAHWFSTTGPGKALCGTQSNIRVVRATGDVPKCKPCRQLMKEGNVDEDQIEAAIEAELAAEAAAKEPAKVPRAMGRRVAQEPRNPSQAMIVDVLPAEAAELYHRHFAALAVRYGFMGAGSKWDALDDATKALHTATWREVLMALRNPRPTSDPFQLPEVLDGHNDDPRLAHRGRNRR